MIPNSCRLFGQDHAQNQKPGDAAVNEQAFVATNLQDLRTHLGNLQRRGKLTRVTIPINKDTELMPLVRWQFRGLSEEQRTGFLFENVTNAKGESLRGGVAVA